MMAKFFLQLYCDKLVEQGVNPWVAQIFKVHSEDFFSDNEVDEFI
jgi:hypothetical protein